MDIRVKQRDTTDCGAACIASVARYYNLDLQIATIRKRAGTDKNGTNVLGMIQAAESFGFEAKGVKSAYPSLIHIPLPAIAHIVVKGGLHHYVVVSSITKESIKIMDPAYGKVLNWNSEEFKNEWTGILILMVPSVNFDPGPEKRDRFSRLWTFLWPHRRLFTQAIFGAIIYTFLGLSTSILIQQIVDRIIPESDFPLLNIMGVSMAMLMVLRIVLGIFKDIIIMRTGQLIDARLILGYYKHLLKLPQEFFDNMRVGEITSRINDAVKIRLFINDVSINLLVSLLMLLASLILMFTYYWKLAVIILLIVPVYFLIYYVTNKLNRKSQRRLMEESADLESQLVESLNSIRTIKSLGLEARSGEQTEARFKLLLKTVYKSGLNSLFSGSSTEFTTQVFILLLLWVGTTYVLSEQISSGELLSFYTLISYFTSPLSSFIGANKLVQDALIAADRLFEIMDLESEHQTEDEKIKLCAKDLGDIRFTEVSFRYGARENIFSNLCMEIPLGKMTGIVGGSGGGKSTLMALLQNIYPLNGGDITIGHHSIRCINNRSLREIVGVVPQVVELFSGTILYNITIGMEAVDLEKVIGICSKLGIKDFIENLPESYNTQIGECGLALSGGQKQRIAIARALYRDPEILILDEATSSMDSLSEQFAQDTISEFISQHKTVIIIAHRLSTIRNADKIIVLKDGLVKEQGLHSELMALRSEYFSLWNKAFNGDMVF